MRDPVIFTIRVLLDNMMAEEESTGEIVESSVSQSGYVVVWTIASLVSFAIFFVYF